MHIDWVHNKVSDFSVDDYPQKLATMQDRLSDIIKGDAFLNEMACFIPQNVHYIKRSSSCF
ncbi:hypothetical protein CSAG_04751 [Citrobacter portucalensis]|nr:hypothetical protein [Salmonella enterica subsp. enterica]EQM94159.1 hypothetical protein CSAG_04751 [Citrobacter portucalensis]